MRLIYRSLTALALTLTVFFPAGGAVAAPAEVERMEDFTTAAFDSCSEQFVTLSGTFHVVTKQSADGSITQHVTFNASGTGEFSGEYILNETQSLQSNADIVFEDHNVLVSKGSAPNQRALVRIDSDGVVTVQIECRG